MGKYTTERPGSWKPEELALFRQLMADGKRYADIAVFMADAGWTRSVSGLHAAATKFNVEYTFDYHKFVAQRRNATLKHRAPSPSAEQPVEPVHKIAPLGGLGCSDGCQYPYRVPGVPGQRYRFCGRPPLRGKPYCPEHCEGLYEAPPPVRAGYVSGRVL